MRKSVVAAAIALIAAPVSATPWVDDLGRSMNFFFPGSKPLQLQAGSHSVADGVQAFQKICLAGAFDKASIGSAVQGLNWNFAYREQMMPFKQPVDVGGWETSDAAVYAAEKIFFNKLPQCNLTFAPAAFPALTDIQAAISAAVGAQPRNADKAFDKKGRPNKRYEPEWALPQADGSTQLIFARLSPTVKGAVHLAVLKKAAK
jgi:hypothetical protein